MSRALPFVLLVICPFLPILLLLIIRGLCKWRGAARARGTRNLRSYNYLERNGSVHAAYEGEEIFGEIEEAIYGRHKRL